MTTETETKLWGGETEKAVENFPVSGHPIPAPVVHWLGRLKAAAARVNAELGQLDAEVAERIAAAGDAVAAGDHDAQFPVDVFQTGSGTSSNMNANEVIANLAGDGAHPNDHVNMGQSSNDVFPSAVHLAALGEVTADLLPALDGLAAALGAKGDEFADQVKSGRTHLMDAVPVTLGQEFDGFAAQIRLGADRVRDTLARVGQIPLGGTATGTGINTHADFAEHVRAKLADATGLEISAPEDRFEAQANRDALVELSGALKVVAVSMIKIGNDLALMGSGPRAGLAELRLPELQKGSSIMPGKVNPVICEVVIQVGDQVIGNDAGDHPRRHPGAVRAQRARAADRPQPARLGEAARRRRPAARPALRQRDRAERGDAPAPRRVDASGRDGAQPAHRLRHGDRDRQGGRELEPNRARGGGRAGCRRVGARAGARLRQDGAPSRIVDRAEIEAAAERIAGRVRVTPALALERGALGVAGELTLKLELHQHAGSFKPRGAFNAILAADVPAAGVAAASGGNFALAVAHAAGELSHPATIFVPEVSPPAKVERLRASGAEVFVTGAFYDDAHAAAHEHAARTGALELHPFDDPLVVAGQGTCARELDRDAPGLDTVLTAVGGGGLCAGTAAWYEDRARIVAVEPERCASLHAALAAGEPVEVEVGGLAADSLGARRIGEHPWAVLSRAVDESVLVSDEAIAAAQRTLWRELRIAAEPGGAAAFAALLDGAYVPAPSERVGVLVCGGNVDPAGLA